MLMQSHLHSERAVLYQALMESLVVRVSEGSTGGRNGTGGLLGVEKALFLRGSVAANNEYRGLLRLLSDPGADEKVLRSHITRFLLALRRDCGQSAYGLENKDWSDLVQFPFSSEHVSPDRTTASHPTSYHGVDAAPPTHRLSPRG